MNVAVAPILIPLLTGLLLLFWSRSGVSRRFAAGASALTQLGIAIALLAGTWKGETYVLTLGDWSARVGIVLVVDTLSAIMLALSTLTAAATILYGFAADEARRDHPLRLPLLQFLIVGINLSFCTGDLFNLFVAFEIMLISSYALLTLEADRSSVHRAFPYVTLNIVGSTLFLCAAAFAYSLFGSLNFAEIAMRAREMGGDPRIAVLAVLLLVVFGLKAGLFPLYYWLPNSYPILATPVASLYAGMLTKVGVYVLLRVFATVLPHDLHFAHQTLAWLAAVTMLVAVMGAISRNFIRGILSFHILSQIGFMVLAIGLFTPLALAACIFYVIHHIIVKASLFLIGGVAARLNGTDDLAKMGNLWKHAPWLGVLFLFQALSLSGLPPLSGFWGKYVILVVGFEQRQFWLVGAAILASILTLFSMLKIWNGAFWNASESVPVRLEDRRWISMTWIVAALVALSVTIGLGAEWFLQLASQAAERALDQEGYAQAVFRHLGKGFVQ